mgnify:CR=1 FL=1
MTTPLTKPRYFLIRDLFLFSCYTGIPYSDMHKLSDDNIFVAGDTNTVWIKTHREKTGMDYDIPLLELPKRILERYRNINRDGRLFPMYSISHLNRELKNIARICGIDRRVTFHMARHTLLPKLRCHKVFLSKR